MSVEPEPQPVPARDPDLSDLVDASIRRVEDHRILTGEAKYIADFGNDETLHAALLRSPHAHARIDTIDVSRGEDHPGCVLVLTGEDLAAEYDPMGCGITAFEEWPLAVDRVRFAGEPVALVVATDRYVAEDVVQRIDVSYDRLDAVVDVREARKDETVLHKDVGTNVAAAEVFEFGQVDDAFETADHVVERTYSWERATGLPLETAGVVAEYDSETDSFDIFSNMQLHTHPGRNTLPQVLGYDPSAVRLHCPEDIGGSFGTKITSLQRYCYLAAVASRKIGRPVKFIEDRVENLQGGDVHGSDREYEVRLAVDDDGSIRGLDMSFLDDFGAYPRFSIHSVIKPLAAVCGPYDIEHIRYGYEIVLTNKTCQTVYRGYGMPQHTFALEKIVDDAARELGIDQTAFRRRNYIEPDQMPFKIPSKNVYDSGDYPAALDRLIDVIDEKERREGGLLDPSTVAERRKEGKYRGTQPSVFLEPSTGGNDWPDRMRMEDPIESFSRDQVDEPPEHFRAEVHPDGTVTASLGTDSAGQGHQTLVTQLLSDELGIPIDDIEVDYLHSGQVPNEMGSAASRMTVMLSGAVAGLSQELTANLKRLAAVEMDCPVEVLEYERGAVINPADGARLTLGELATVDQEDDGTLTSLTHEYGFPGTDVDDFDDAYVNKLPIFATTAFSVNAPIVEVDVETGAVDILRYYTLHDAGTAVNPMMLEGQVHGATAHGIGLALLQEFQYNDIGQPVTTTLFDYLLPSIDNIPEMVLLQSETPSPFTVNGSKGAAEGGTIAAPAAVAISVNAALEPLDSDIDRIPISPKYLRARLRGSGSTE